MSRGGCGCPRDDQSRSTRHVGRGVATAAQWLMGLRPLPLPPAGLVLWPGRQRGSHPARPPGRCLVRQERVGSPRAGGRGRAGLRPARSTVRRASTRAGGACGEVEGVSVAALRQRLKATARVRLTPAQMRQLREAPDSASLFGLRDRALLAAMVVFPARRRGPQHGVMRLCAVWTGRSG